MNGNALRKLTHTLALAAAVLWLASPAPALGAEIDFGFHVAGNGALRLAGVKGIKVPVELAISVQGTPTQGSWDAIDGDEFVYSGSLHRAHPNERDLGVVFRFDSLVKLGKRLEERIAEERGVTVQVLSVSLRPTVLKVDSKWKKTAVKLVFDFAALVDGQYRIGTYIVPLQGVVTLQPR